MIATETGWQTRAPRRSLAAALLASFGQADPWGTASFNDIASGIDDGSGGHPSRQAVAERCAAMLTMVETILRLAIARKSSLRSKTAAMSRTCWAATPAMLVQDGTIVELPAWLFAAFSGVANGVRQVCNARIQAIYDLKSMRFEAFAIDAYSKNDLSAAPRNWNCVRRPLSSA